MSLVYNFSLRLLFGTYLVGTGTTAEMGSIKASYPLNLQLRGLDWSIFDHHFVVLRLSLGPKPLPHTTLIQEVITSAGENFHLFVV